MSPEGCEEVCEAMLRVAQAGELAIYFFVDGTFGQAPVGRLTTSSNDPTIPLRLLIE